MFALAVAPLIAALRAPPPPGVPVATLWGQDSIRLGVPRAGAVASAAPRPPLLPVAGAVPVLCAPGDSVANGNLRVECAGGERHFYRVFDGQLLMTETVRFVGAGDTRMPDGASWPPVAPPPLAVTLNVGMAEVFGLGQQRQTCYPEGGRQTPPLARAFAPNATLTYVLAAGEGGAANTLPFLLGTTVGRGGDFGVWLNLPGTGNVTLDATDDASRTVTWFIDAAEQLDYVVATHPQGALANATAFSLLERFTEWVGRSPGLPRWALGFWQSKNRYASQQELLDAARGFANRSIPVDIIVIDWMHWKKQGDWHFDSVAWPDPSAMVREVKALGMEIMVTVWPFSVEGSMSYSILQRNGWLVDSVSAPARGVPVYENDSLHGALVDVTVPAAREFVWSQVRDGYHRHGIRVFWLDASEPEYYIMPAWGKRAGKDAAFAAGQFDEIGQLFAWYWVQTFRDGMRVAGENTSVTLPRGGYAGAWRFGAGLWSGDIHCNFNVLRGQLQTGLSAQMSGFGLWTSDVGGYSAGPGDSCAATNSSYRELVVRWFQFGCTCPIFRQHGQRETEVWLYGPEAEAAVTRVIRWRAGQKDYVAGEMAKLNATGRPINRPLWWDFPHDPRSWTANSSYMFGDKYLASPVVHAGAREKLVFLPCPPPPEWSSTKIEQPASSKSPRHRPGAGCAWRHAWTGAVLEGGQTHVVAAPLDEFPLFERMF